MLSVLSVEVRSVLKYMRLSKGNTGIIVRQNPKQKAKKQQP